jgi:hypothetical protein
VTGSNDEYEYFAQDAPYWSAVGIRPPSGQDWDLWVYESAPFGTCVDGLLAASRRTTGVDIVVGDFNHNATGFYYVTADRFSAGTSSATVEWDDNTSLLVINAPLVSRSTNSSDVLECWDVLLQAGVNYRIQFNPAGSANLRVLLFRNPASTTYWATRNAATIESGASFNYTAPATDYYGIVVLNDNGQSGSYTLAVGTCTSPDVLTSGTSLSGVAQSSFYSFNEGEEFWAAVGSRALNPADDYDVDVFGVGAGGLYPVCFTNPLAASHLAPGLVDFVVGDFDFNPLGTYYARSYLFSGSGSGDGQRTEWDDGADQIYVNGPVVVQSTGASDVLTCWDVDLRAGTAYELHFNPGVPGLRCLVFENQGQGITWQPRSSAVVNTPTSTTYTPTVNGFHGVVVVNDGGQAGSYSIWFTACPPPSQLGNGIPQVAHYPQEFYRYQQLTNRWNAVGLRQILGEWSLRTFSQGSGAPAPDCFTGQLTAVGQGAGLVNFVVGDFNSGGNAIGNYYVLPRYTSGPDGDAYLEWDSGTDDIQVDATPISRDLSYADVIECWDVALQAGQTYTIYFQRDPGTAATWHLFRSNGAPFWGTRSNAVASGSTHAHFTAPATDRYGLVVANDQALTGHYRLGVYRAAVPVEEAIVPAVTTLRSLIPNPGVGRRSIRFDLHTAATVGFEIVDVAGRVVVRLAEREFDAGEWSVPWDGLSNEGTRIGPGVYFVRMRVDGHVLGREKFAILK